MILRHDKYVKVLSLLGLAVSGTLLGFYCQKLADSGQLQSRKIFLACVVSAGSYLVAFFVIETLGRSRRGSHWVVSTIAGSVLSAFNLKVVKFMVANTLDQYSSVFEEIYEIGVRFLIAAVIFVVVAIIIIGVIQFLGRRLERMFGVVT
jgi:hypothetical protein